MQPSLHWQKNIEYNTGKHTTIRKHHKGLEKQYKYLFKSKLYSAIPNNDIIACFLIEDAAMFTVIRVNSFRQFFNLPERTWIISIETL